MVSKHANIRYQLVEKMAVNTDKEVEITKTLLPSDIFFLIEIENK